MMTTPQKRVYPWKYAAFRGLAFAVVLSLLSFGCFLLIDILLPPPSPEMAFEFGSTYSFMSLAALSYISTFGFSLILGLFVFVRLLRTRVTFLFIITQAIMLWFVLVLFSLLPLAPFLFMPSDVIPWKDYILNWDFLTYQITSLIRFLIPVALTFWFLKAIRLF